MSLVQSILEKYGIQDTMEAEGTSVSSVSAPGEQAIADDDVGFDEEQTQCEIHSAFSVDRDCEKDPISRLLPKLTEAIEQSSIDNIFNIPVRELRTAAGRDWPELIKQRAQLEAFAESLRTVRLLRQGRVPEHYTATTSCQTCGQVPIFEGCPSEVHGCPWCFAGTLPSLQGQL